MESITFEQIPQAIGLLQQKLERIEQLILTNTTKGPEQPDTLLTIQEAAAFLRLSVATIYGKVHDRELPFSKQGKRLYFSKAELTAWVHSGRQKTAAEVQAEANNYIAGRPR